MLSLIFVLGFCKINDNRDKKKERPGMAQMDTDKKIARSDYYLLFKINLSENLCQLKQVLILCRSASKLEAN